MLFLWLSWTLTLSFVATFLFDAFTSLFLFTTLRKRTGVRGASVFIKILKWQELLEKLFAGTLHSGFLLLKGNLSDENDIWTCLSFCSCSIQSIKRILILSGCVCFDVFYTLNNSVFKRKFKKKLIFFVKPGWSHISPYQGL